MAIPKRKVTKRRTKRPDAADTIISCLKDIEKDREARVVALERRQADLENRIARLENLLGD